MDHVITEMERQESKTELKKLYDEITKIYLETMKTSKDKIPPSVTLILPGKIMVPFTLDLRDNIETLCRILNSGPVTAVITMAMGWAVRSDGHGWEHFSQEPLPRSEEIFIAIIESADMRITKTWEIRRNKNGEMIFPLENPEVFWDDESLELNFITRQKTEIKN